jgi:hypothetical protein
LTTEAQRRALQADIRAAFAQAVRPTADLIAPHQCDECARIRSEFSQAHRDALPDAFIEEHRSALPLLSPEALLYFLPAYLLYALDHLTSRTGASEMTVYAVTPNSSTDAALEDWARERVALFTDEQAGVIDRFLELVQHDDDLGAYMGDVADRRARFHELRAMRDTS